jgi:hypothetical protein
MRKAALLLIAMVLLVTLTAVSAAGSYLCLPKGTVGFQYDDSVKIWKRTDFNSSAKYIVSRSQIKNYAWEVKYYGQKEPMSLCRENFNDLGYLFCENAGEFRMNRKNMRYIRTYILGYYNCNVEDETGKIINEDGSCTPFIEIGSCTKLPSFHPQ